MRPLHLATAILMFVILVADRCCIRPCHPALFAAAALFFGLNSAFAGWHLPPPRAG